MEGKSSASIASGFLILFIVYHFPEFYSSFWLMAIFKIGFLFSAYFIARLQGWRGLEGFGLKLRNRWALKLIAGIFAGLIFFAIAVFFSHFLGYETITGKLSLTPMLKSLPMILIMTLFPSIAEDILTRGYLFGHLKSLRSFVWILLSSTVYLLNHIWRLDDGPSVLLYLFVFGILLAIAVWFTGSLWLAFGIHWGANIAFEISAKIPTAENPAYPEGPNWILTFTWTILLFFLLLFVRSKYLPVNHFSFKKEKCVKSNKQ
jgi:hypothetical protein